MSLVKVVSLDMEGTLIDHSFSNVIWDQELPRLYAEKHGCGLDTALTRVEAEYCEVGAERIEWYDVDYWFRRWGLEVDWRQLIRGHAHLIKVYPEVAEALQKLRRVYPIVVSSNTIREFLELQLEAVGGRFDRVFSAPSDFKMVKRDEGFFRKILDALTLEPYQLAHVGDHKEFDYYAAKSLGVEAYYLDRSGAARGPDTVRDLLEFVDRLMDA
jgi:FMN phosphatase YigB (HAD superfamily)